MTSFAARIGALASEADAEVATLRERLQASEAERMQSQLQCLQHKTARQDLEGELRRVEDENQRLRQEVEAAREERTVEAAQLGRINELSRELIATRFELAAAVAAPPNGGGSGGRSPLLGVQQLAAALSYAFANLWRSI